MGFSVFTLRFPIFISQSMQVISIFGLKPRNVYLPMFRLLGLIPAYSKWVDTFFSIFMVSIGVVKSDSIVAYRKYIVFRI